ncbi:PIN domain-containing protein [Candidatus Roizmanbacteria bacterium]|nr:PIN domain-containing protein [Candidatus Roizmanbacteria bacterium]
MKNVFFDSSVILAASKSKSGGSSFILMLCRKGRIKGYISRYVVYEIKKSSSILNQQEKQRLNFLILQCKLEIIDEPSEKLNEKYYSMINKKDASILASAISTTMDYLLTLNTKHFMTPELKIAVKPMKIVTPKDFIIIEKFR